MPLLAVLIDADNTSPKVADEIFAEVAKFGEAGVRRIYGDFSGTRLKGWASKLAALGIVPHQQFANTTGKNSSDIALVIDAMDLLLSGRFNGFVLVSSDSDFTRLASRIREQGLDVIGIGEKKTPSAFQKACKRFIFIENLASDITEEKPAGTLVKKQPPTKAIPLINKAILDIPDDDEWYLLTRIGSQLVASHPEFDSRTYGSAKLSNLIEATGAYEIDKSNGPLRIRKKKGR